MIPKPLNEIEWSDLEALRDSGREEDDTIEYKASFSGGSDYLALSPNEQIKAVNGLVKEAIAFLNGRGGDIVIGAKEAANDHPKIEAITPVSNIDATADRLAVSIAALVEPTQSVLGVRAIRKPEGANDGVIIVRAPSSLRAPHRSTRTNECYVRRGRASVPMPMDEVQDVAVRRADLRRERLQILSNHFADFDSNHVGRTALSAHRFHIRSVFMPLQDQEIEIDDALCAKLRGSDPVLKRGGTAEQIDLPFRYLDFKWKPVLRGKRIETLHTGMRSNEDFLFCAKEIRGSGVMLSDFACRVTIGESEANVTGFYGDWLAGYLANTLVSFGRVWSERPNMGQGMLRIATRSAGEIASVTNQGMWGDANVPWPKGMSVLPDFEIVDGESFLDSFPQAQIDVASIIGLELPNPFVVA